MRGQVGPYPKADISIAASIVSALESEVRHGQDSEKLDMHLNNIQRMVVQSPKLAESLATVGVVPVVVDLLKRRAGNGDRLEVVLVTVGVLA